MTPLARSRRAAQAAFATQGLVYISLTARLPRFQDHWGLSDLGLSGLLLMMVLLAGLGSVSAESLAKRHASATLLRLGLGLIAVAVPLLTTAPAMPLFILGLALYGVGLGAVDAGTNMQAVALEHAYGRPILPSFHGAWTLGGVLGAALALALGNAPLWADAFLCVIPLAVATLPLLPRVGAVEDAAIGDVPWRPILLVGLGMVLFYMVDTAAQTWGPTYLDDVFPTPHRLVALATFPYLVASLALRLAGDGLVARHGVVPVLRTGALVACAALAVVVFAPSWPVAVVGFTFLGAGVAVIAPLSFSAAARIAGGAASDFGSAERARVDAVIARFNQFNYLGALLGSVLTGVVGSGTLRVGFAVPMVLILGILPLARAFAASPQQVSATE
ncbi:MFS transporter [Nocardioides sp.]|jgi:MFS family permease|uniref:MFS transporter n=1 Tax=Nocardioides sp. TaxID=35761 RepID=UPI002BB1A023|nr:MFS transporter [Nocardioides sp.]HVX54347.1 MFS transporter [Nocardioides sp.]